MAVPILSGRDNNLSNGLWQRYRNEIVLGIKIILARFIDDSNQSVFYCNLVSQRKVDFALFKRYSITVVLYADYELHSYQNVETINLSTP